MRKGKKGRLFSFCMAIAMVVNILFSGTIPVSAEAAADENGFVIEDGVLTRYTGNEKNVVVPEGVTGIGLGAFYNCTDVESIDLPESVTSIGDKAFVHCGSLKAINVAEKNTAYASEDGVLYTKEKTELICCPGGKTGSVEAPESVTVIWDYAFTECSGLKSIELPGAVSIGNYALEYCSGLERIELPGAASIGNGAFRDCSSLERIGLPGATSIGDYAFWGCSSLKSIELPSVTSIGGYAFYDCSSLERIELPSVASIGNSAFYGCSSLESVELPGATSIGSAAFYGCAKLTIYGSAASYAETYAKENQIPFTTIGLEMKKESTDDWYTLGSETGITLTCSGALSDLVSVSVDGEFVDEAKYSKTEGSEGSTIVTFTKEFMETLSEGKHIFTLEYTKGRKAETVVTVSTEPEYTLGDADGDGKMNTSDALAILKHLARLPQKKFIEAAANVDGEGGITTQDALMILKCLASLAQMPSRG